MAKLRCLLPHACFEDWFDEIAEQVAAKTQKEAQARVLERLRAAEKAREEARAQADKQEKKAQADAEARHAEYIAQAGSGGRPEVRLTNRATDEKRWTDFETKLQTLSTNAEAGQAAKFGADDVPWPSGPPENPLRIDPAGHPAVVRSQLRAGLLRWHPDKFAQRVGRFLPSEGTEKQGALDRVKEIAQQLTRLMSDLALEAKPSNVVAG